MTAQCTSQFGPQGCGHIATPEKPVCDICQAAHDGYVRRSAEDLDRNAIQWLQSRGYTVLKLAGGDR